MNHMNRTVRKVSVSRKWLLLVERRLIAIHRQLIEYQKSLAAFHRELVALRKSLIRQSVNQILPLIFIGATLMFIITPVALLWDYEVQKNDFVRFFHRTPKLCPSVQMVSQSLEVNIHFFICLVFEKCKNGGVTVKDLTLPTLPPPMTKV